MLFFFMVYFRSQGVFLEKRGLRTQCYHASQLWKRVIKSGVDRLRLWLMHSAERSSSRGAVGEYYDPLRRPWRVNDM